MPHPSQRLYTKYPCEVGNPLACALPQRAIQQQPEAQDCPQCGFPVVLPSEARIRGDRGTYQIERWLGHRGQGRLYSGLELPTRQAVVIKEYLLPERYFNPEEIKIRKVAFRRLAGLELADGRVQDFRLIVPTDAVADPLEERCYLISTGKLDASMTLANYLAQNGAMNRVQVRQLLNQVLQSLESLHGQKFRLPSGLVQQGIAHGNLRLDSLLFVESFQGFFTYLSDFALWERLFDPPLLEAPTPTPQQDLKALGNVAFYLLVGGSRDPVSGQPWHPETEAHWPSLHPDFKAFLLNLMGLGSASFESAEAARQVLLQLPPEVGVTQLPSQATPQGNQKHGWRSRLPIALLGILGIFLLVGLLAWLLRGRSQRGSVVANELLPCCIDQVSGIPAGQFVYTAAQRGSWDYAFTQQNLITRNQSFQEILEEHQPLLSNWDYQRAVSGEAAKAQVQSGQIDFAIASLHNSLEPELGQIEFAYDGLAVFVAFSYSRRENSLPSSLRGQITFEQLRQLYTGKITNWQQLNGPDLPVKLYIPTHDEAVQLFEQRVLQEPTHIDVFRRLVQPVDPSSEQCPNTSSITQLGTFATLRAIIRDFESCEVGSIGFESLSQIFGQCSVYPLALARERRPAVVPLIQGRNKPVTPATNLCNDKGGYRPNAQAFRSQQYPLTYSLAVVYFRDNRRAPAGQKFAELLKTVEAQRLLQKTGLIPLQSLEEEVR